LSCASAATGPWARSKDFDLTETAVREWVKQAERDTGTRDDGGLTSSEKDELISAALTNAVAARNPALRA
jgi:transposase-like protein